MWWTGVLDRAHRCGASWSRLACRRRSFAPRTGGVSQTTSRRVVLHAMPSAVCRGRGQAAHRLRAKRLRATRSIGGSKCGGMSLRTSGGLQAGGTRPMTAGSAEPPAFLAPSARWTATAHNIVSHIQRFCGFCSLSNVVLHYLFPQLCLAVFPSSSLAHFTLPLQ